jgi:hypothetical protein
MGLASSSSAANASTLHASQHHHHYNNAVLSKRNNLHTAATPVYKSDRSVKHSPITRSTSGGIRSGRNTSRASSPLPMVMVSHRAMDMSRAAVGLVAEEHGQHQFEVLIWGDSVIHCDELQNKQQKGG